MVAPVIFGYLVFFSYVCHGIAQLQPPVVNETYRAMGEMVEKLQDGSGTVIQVTFEENYDSITGDAAFTAWEMGKTVTFIESGITGQTIKYADGKECEVITVEDWIAVEAPPSLMGYKNTDGKIRFSLRQLFNLDSKNLVKEDLGASVTYRGIPAKRWIYEVSGKEYDGKDSKIAVYAYWSDGTWNTTSHSRTVPLGYEVTKIIYGNKTEGITDVEQFISILAFTHGALNKKVFEPVEGIVCENRTSAYQFPSIPKMEAVSFRSEYILPDYQEVRYIETWYDPKNLMLRFDTDRIGGQNPYNTKAGRKFTSIITSMLIGTTFQMDIYKGAMTCKVYPVEDYEFEDADLINIKTKKWSLDNFFGRNTTNYTYIGKTWKRNIPCHIFQGIREDWPTPASGIKSLWEWCFAINMTENDLQVNYRDKELPLVNLQINILESSVNQLPPKYRMAHHFHDVRSEESATVDAMQFDISGCFSENETKSLQFTVDVTIDDDNIHIMENATSDINFLRLWKTAICYKSDLPMESMRVAKVQSTVFEKTMYVSFTLLDRHKNLPDLIKQNQRSLDEAYKFLLDAVNTGELSISYKPSAKAGFIVLKAAKDTLVNQVYRPTPIEVSTQVPPLTKPTAIPTLNFSLIIDSLPPTTLTGEQTLGTKPTQGTDSPGTDKPVGKDKGFPGHSKGTVAGVCITMLIIGFSIGAGGTFYKYRGLPFRR